MNPAVLKNPAHLPNVLGFAGHRMVEDPLRLREIIDGEIAAHVREHGGHAICYSSAAAGSDLVFLESAAAQGCEYWVVLPFPADQFARDFDSSAEWDRARRLIERAAWHGVLAPDPGEPPADNEYQFAARHILRLAGRMLFYWDGQPARGPGGTAETVDDALHENIPARVIDAGTLALRDLP